MTVELDARGLVCPQPVIKAKKALESMEKGVLKVIVDNETARENLKKLSNSLGLKAVVKNEGQDIIVEISKDQDIAQNVELAIDCPISELDDQVFLIQSEFLGQGSEELGNILMKGFIFTLSETSPMPKKVMFLNSAVKLTTTNEDSVQNLKKMEEAGVEIMSCGTCLDFYGLKESLKVGKVSNMYDIVESLKGSSNSVVI